MEKMQEKIKLLDLPGLSPELFLYASELVQTSIYFKFVRVAKEGDGYENWEENWKVDDNELFLVILRKNSSGFYIFCTGTSECFLFSPDYKKEVEAQAMFDEICDHTSQEKLVRNKFEA